MITRFAAVWSAGLLLLIGCAPQVDQTLEENKEVVRQYVEAYNNHDLEALDGLFLPDFVRHSKATSEVHSLAEFKGALSEATEAFPDERIEIVNLVAEADKVVVFGTWSGTQEAPYGGLPATGRRAEIPFFYLFRLEEGRIAEFWTEWDNVNFMAQLGHYPPPADTSGESDHADMGAPSAQEGGAKSGHGG